MARYFGQQSPRTPSPPCTASGGTDLYLALHDGSTDVMVFDLHADSPGTQTTG